MVSPLRVAGTKDPSMHKITAGSSNYVTRGIPCFSCLFFSKFRDAFSMFTTFSNLV